MQRDRVRTLRRAAIGLLVVLMCAAGVSAIIRSARPPAVVIYSGTSSLKQQSSWIGKWIPQKWTWLRKLKWTVFGRPKAALVEVKFAALNQSPESFFSRMNLKV